MRKLRGRLTYANVMATIAVFIALGGASYAATQLPKNSVGSKQLKKNAITTAKIKDAAVTGAKVNLSTLGTVPSATSAANAGHADTANTATNAGHADTANTATNAGHADTAATATALSPPEALHFIGDPGEPKYLSGWEIAPGYGPMRVGFWKDHDCMVHLTGVVEGGEEPGAFRLPPADWPFQELNFPLIRPTTAVKLAWALIEEENGEVRLYFEPGETEGSVSLDGVVFRAASC